MCGTIFLMGFYSQRVAPIQHVQRVNIVYINIQSIDRLTGLWLDIYTFIAYFKKTDSLKVDI